MKASCASTTFSQLHKLSWIMCLVCTFRGGLMLAPNLFIPKGPKLTLLCKQGKQEVCQCPAMTSGPQFSHSQSNRAVTRRCHRPGPLLYIMSHCKAMANLAFVGRPTIWLSDDEQMRLVTGSLLLMEQSI